MGMACLTRVDGSECTIHAGSVTIKAVRTHRGQVQLTSSTEGDVEMQVQARPELFLS